MVGSPGNHLRGWENIRKAALDCGSSRARGKGGAEARCREDRPGYDTHPWPLDPLVPGQPALLGLGLQFCHDLRYVGFSPHHQTILQQQLGVLRFSSILTSTWRQRQSPQVKGTVPQDCRFPVQKPSQVQIVTNAPDQLAVDHRFCDPLLRPD